MAVLTQYQRNKLESAVKQARKIAETGALNVLCNLSVDRAKPFAHLNEKQKLLREDLKTKSLLLGDNVGSDGTQSIKKLAYELAYETWHKMLFAKFLEVNNLLINPDDVTVSMEECDELAKEEGFKDKWDIASNYASKMLPAIFRPNDPLMQVTFSTEERIKLEEIIDSLEKEIFISDDALGWVYQFWQSEEKSRINASGEKIDGEKLPAVTQLFTEPYMVHFLIDNTIGAWWVSRNPGVKPPIKFEYLRLLDDGTPAAGKFEGWPDKTSEVTALDPCMGSGHFIVSLFLVFTSLRMYEEGLSKVEATIKVIEENLYGLEIDNRCTQIATFNLALTAWKFCGKFTELPEMNLACSGIAPKGKVEDWIKLVDNIEDPTDKVRMQNGMKLLYEHFQLAPELGSLIDPSIITANLETASFEELHPVLKKALENEKNADNFERGVIAADISKTGQLLTKKYTIHITNVPFLGKGKQDQILSEYAKKYYPEAKADLSTVFFVNSLKTAHLGGTICSVMPQNWLFLTSYQKYRILLLRNVNWNFVIRLGEHAFDNADAAGAFACMVSITNRIPTKEDSFFSIIASNNRGERSIYATEKKILLKTADFEILNQLDQITNPDSRIIFHKPNNIPILSAYADTGTGLQSFDHPRFIFSFWELIELKEGWLPLQTAPSRNSIFSGMNSAIKWQDGKGELFHLMQLKEKQGYKSGIWKAGIQFWGKRGILHSVMADLPMALYLGYPYDTNAAVIIPKDERYLTILFAFSYTGEFAKSIRNIDQKLMVTNATFLKISFDINHWEKVAFEQYPNGLPEPYSDDLTQWLFHGHPVKAEYPLQVAVARILGYRWPSENDTKMELSEEARELINDVKRFDYLTDDDGIFCIPSVNAEQAGADRLREYLQEVFKEDWNSQIISQFLQKEGAKSGNIEEWLRNEFFIQHCKIFQNRPFIWHIWDGRKDGFSVLVNYHKFDKKNLSKLIHTYLGDWIRMCESKKKLGESGAEGLLNAANKLKEKLKLIREGENPYDIFVRWKFIEKQSIGWEPDLNDGVRLNIRPFIITDVLRKKPNIKYGIDRGKNPPGSPWGEIRDNDKHLNLNEKRDSRKKSY